jgi:hypothetical protein
MKAEQRSSIRKAISLNNVINYDLTYSKRWKVRNLSPNGAMVEMRRDELLRGNPGGGGSRAQAAWRIWFAPSAHGGGAHGQEWRGIAVPQLDDRAYTALVNLLYSA